MMHSPVSMTVQGLTKPMIAGLLALILLPGVAGTSAQEEATDFEDVGREARELLSAIGDYSASQRDEAMDATEEALDKLDRNIESMEHSMRKRWDSMDAATREQARESMRELRKKRNELSEWYGAMKNSSGGAWDEMKDGFSEAFETMGDAWEKAVAEFRK